MAEDSANATPAPEQGRPRAPAETLAELPAGGAPEDVEIDVAGAHPGFATTALGPGDVRDTPRMPSMIEEAVADPDPWIGRTLSNVYRVEGKIGEGGMGSVYVARHVHLSKQYAVKVLSAAIAQNATAVERLKQEAIAASSIDHDNIIDVISFDRYVDGSVFIVMEMLRGESLAARLSNGPLTFHHAIAVAHQIAAALGAAHERGIVHRDLKPENVFLSKNGEVERVKVLDFGISKVKTADAEQVRMTRTGQLVGTPLYMSPEQARGEVDIDRRVDVYALGVILYETLTGSPPFDGRNYFELLWKHGNEPPQSPRRRNPNVFIPEGVEAVILRALAKNREERFGSMHELSEALRAAAPDVPVPSMISLPPPSGEVRTSSPTPRPSQQPSPSARTESGERRAMHTGVRSSEDEGLPIPDTTPPPALPASSGVRTLAIAMLAGLSLVTVGYFAMQGGEPPATAPVAADPEPHVEAPLEPPPVIPVARDPDPEDVPPPMPSVVELALDSTPPGAEVRAGDTVLCTTPCFADVPRGSDPLALTFRREGYFDGTQTVVPSEGTSVSVRLRARRRAGETGSGGGGGGSVSIKTEI